MRSLLWEGPVPTGTGVSTAKASTVITGNEGAQIPELLAPAGSWEALLSAIGAGADAVYLGGKKFGARQSAQNFENSQITEAIELAHRQDIRIYVTVNTLIKEWERKEAILFLLFLSEAGVDAVLLQDAGLAYLARKIIPTLPLYASTQMTIHNSEGVLWAAERGFQRVVLSRELQLPEIFKIGCHTAQCPIGLEVFVHGALCYGYSGQCLLSSSIGGRSGNRGLCAQPCRKPYQLVSYETDSYDRPVSITSGRGERYFLSMQDLCAYSILDQVARAPITALKIEGRMKSPEYVATVVRIYRKALDRIRAGSWQPLQSDIRDLLLAFNRGFTGGHLSGENRRTVVGSDRQDNRGLPIGVVRSCNAHSRQVTVQIRGDIVPSRGDGLHFFLSGRDGVNAGMEVTSRPQMRGDLMVLTCHEPVPKDALVSITRRGSLEREAHHMRRKIPSTPLRKISVEMEVSWENGRPRFQGVIHRRDGRVIPVIYHSSDVMEPAIKHPLTTSDIATQLCKTGGTPFIITSCHLRYPGGLFAPPAQINRMRRGFLNAIETALVNEGRRGRDQHEEALHKITDEFRSDRRAIEDHTRESSPPDLTTHVSTLSGLRAAVEGGCSRVCIEAHPDSMSDILTGMDTISLGANPQLVWKWPRITKDAAIASALKIVPFLSEKGIREIMADTPGAAKAIRHTVPEFPISGSMGLNVWNHDALSAYAPLFSSLTLSPELSLTQIRALVKSAEKPRPFLEVLVQGNLEVMISESCLFGNDSTCGKKSCRTFSEVIHWGLIDQTRRLFPVEVDDDCRIHLFNAVETCAIDHLRELGEIGIDRMTIDARFRSPQYIRDIVSLYKEALVHLYRGGLIPAGRMTELKEEIRKRSRGGLTHGPLRSQ